MIRTPFALLAASGLGFLAQLDIEQWAKAPAWVAFCCVCIYAIRAVYTDLGKYRSEDRVELKSLRLQNTELLREIADLNAELQSLKAEQHEH